MPKDTESIASNVRQASDPRIIAALVVMSLLIIVLAYFVYANKVETLKRSDVVIVNTSQLMQRIMNQTTNLSPKQAADLITSAANDLASEGKIVIRQEAAWGAPEGNYLHVQE